MTLEGRFVKLEPLTLAHAESLVSAAGDGELWNSTVTVVPSRDNIAEYIQAALDGQTQGRELPFAIIRKSARSRGALARPRGAALARSQRGALARPSGRAQVIAEEVVVGTTRFYEMRPSDRAVAIGYTWLGKSAQRTAVNTETKLLLLTHAFEHWQCLRVELITDVLNEQSRAAILRLGAKQEGILRKHLILPSGRVRDSVVFSIIDSEWPEVKTRLAARLVDEESS